jgi:hypothetical protein
MGYRNDKLDLKGFIKRLSEVYQKMTDEENKAFLLEATSQLDVDIEVLSGFPEAYKIAKVCAGANSGILYTD